MLVPFHCTQCSEFPPSHSSVPKISRFFTVSGGVFGLFLILSLVLQNLPPTAMITLVCLGSIFITTAIVSEIINYFVREKRQKQEETTRQSQLKLMEQVIIEFSNENTLSDDVYFNFENTSEQIMEFAKRILSDLHGLTITNSQVLSFAAQLRNKYPIDKNISSMEELADLMNSYLSLSHDHFTSLQDENLKKYCAFASLFPLLRDVLNLNYEIRLHYKRSKISSDVNWYCVADISRSAFLAICIAQKQNIEDNEEIPFSLIFYHLLEQKKQMVTIMKKIKEIN